MRYLETDYDRLFVYGNMAFNKWNNLKPVRQVGPEPD